MRPIFHIALNDLRNVFAQKSVLISLFLVPILMTIFLGLVSGGAPTRIVVDVASDPSAGPLGNQIKSLINRTESGNAAVWVLCDFSAGVTLNADCGTPTEAERALPTRDLITERVKTGKALAAIVIPANFSADILAGNAVSVELIGKTGLNAPELVVNKVNSALTRLNGAVNAARVVTAIKNPSDPTERAAFYQKVYDAADAIWATDPVRIEDQSTDGRSEPSATNFGQSAPGMGAMFVMINALGLAGVFLTERQNGVLPRLIQMPVAKWQILAGKLLGRYVLGLIVFGVLIGVGTLFGVRWGNPFGIVAIVAIYVLAVTAMALALSTVVRSQGQAAGLALLVSLTLAPLGGAWWPLDIVPAWMRTVGHISPIAWAQDAFSKLLYYNGTLLDIMPMLAVLLLFAAVFFAFGISRFKYE